MKKKIWPLPSLHNKKLIIERGAGFGAERKYKYGKGKHCGIDIYAPAGSKVVAIEDGIIVRVSDFTGYPSSPQWRKTWYIMVEHNDKRVAVYGELRKPKLKKGKIIMAGQLMGYVSKVLYGKNDYGSSMLHFELHKKGSRIATDWYQKRPKHLINPTNYLKSI